MNKIRNMLTKDQITDLFFDKIRGDVLEKLTDKEVTHLVNILEKMYHTGYGSGLSRSREIREKNRTV